MVAQLKLDDFADHRADESQVDKRATRRKRVLLPARIAFGMTAADCTVIDLSNRGARIYAPSVLGLPDEVHLLMFREGRIVRARRIWADFPSFGLKFLATEQAEGSLRPQAVALKKDWDDWLNAQNI